MNFSKLLAITSANQRIVILDSAKEVIKSNTCLYLWECNIQHDKKILNLEVKNNELHVTLDVIHNTKKSQDINDIKLINERIKILKEGIKELEEDAAYLDTHNYVEAEIIAKKIEAYVNEIKELKQK